MVETKIKKPIQGKVKHGKVIAIYSGYTVTIFILNVESIELSKILKYSNFACIWAAMSNKSEVIKNKDWDYIVFQWAHMKPDSSVDQKQHFSRWVL